MQIGWGCGAYWLRWCLLRKIRVMPLPVTARVQVSVQIVVCPPEASLVHAGKSAPES